MSTHYTAESISRALFHTDSMHTCCCENNCFEEYDVELLDTDPLRGSGDQGWVNTARSSSGGKQTANKLVEDGIDQAALDAEAKGSGLGNAFFEYEDGR